jgi:ribonuclease HI
MIEIYTDGACSGNPGPGGWAAVIVRDGATEELGGHEAQTTNNRMELRAALEALRHVPPELPVRIHTDSQYLLNGMTRWIGAWRRRGWVTTEGRPVENRDLWEALDAAAGRRVIWEYVRGHAGDEGNERANAIAQAHAARRRTPPAGAALQARNEVVARRPGVSYLSLVDGEVRRHATWEECRARVHGVSGARFKKCASAAEEEATLRGWGVPPEALAGFEGRS